MRTSTRSPTPARDLVLVGGGHSHVQTLRRFAIEPPASARLTVVVDTPIAVYSGMVPGYVAGQYRAAELEIDVVPLARRARARVIFGRAVGVDPAARRIAVEGRPPVAYDLASFDIGSTVAGLELPGIREHAVPTRPIGRFVGRVDAMLERAASNDGDPVVIVGGGAGGIELAFTLRHRLGERGSRSPIVLLQAAETILPGYPARLIRRIEHRATERGIELRCGTQVLGAAPGRVEIDGQGGLACSVLVWVTGAVAQPIFRDSGLPVDGGGFVKTRPTLQIEGHDDLFAVGDCATLSDHPETPKAGVYAVRQGPYVTDNLLARLAGAPLRRYRPQRDFLTLLNLGGGTAAGSKWRRSFEGPWVMRLKDRIDRRFMARFQVLGEDGLTSDFDGMAPMDGDTEMLCGGCAAKVGQSSLEAALARLGSGPGDPSLELGLAHPDDAAAWRTPRGDLIAATIDSFRAFTDDAYVVGQVAAANAVSDLYATGVEPRWALAQVSIPEALGRRQREETLFQALAGARAVLDPLAVAVAGGHSTVGPEMAIGFSVEGIAEPGVALLKAAGLANGDLLVLTKPLGTGVLFNADMSGLARGPWIERALASMVRVNRDAARVARRSGAVAATDVSGFGLAGHLAEMLRASGVSAVLELGRLPALDGALELLERGARSTFHPENARLKTAIAAEPAVHVDPRFELLFDPQTSGGLLFGIRPERAEETLERLAAAGDTAAIVGEVGAARDDGKLIAVGGS